MTLVLLAALAAGPPAAAAGPSERALAAARAEALFVQGRELEAFKAYRALVARATDWAEPALDASVLARDLGQLPEAYRLMQAAGRLKPGDAAVQVELGRLATDVGDSTGALSAFDRALALDPASGDALEGRGRALAELGRADEALDDLEKAERGSPSSALAPFLLARVLEDKDRGEDAIDAYERALKRDPSWVEARLALARLQARLVSADEAWRSYSRVLDVDKDNAAAERARAKLRPRLTARPEELRAVERLGRFAPFQAAAARPGVPALRVGIGTDAKGRPLPKAAVVFKASGPFEVRDPANGRRLLLGPANQPWIARRSSSRRGFFELVDPSRRRRLLFKKKILLTPASASDSLIFQELNFGEGYEWSRLRDRQLRGSVELDASGRGLYIVDIVSLEEYLYSVVPEEMPATFPEEALKAQAVIARSYTLFTRRIVKPHRRHGYDVCDGQHCQVYGGIASEAERARAAVDATRGQALVFRGRAAQTPYASNCGGIGQASSELAGWVSVPYLRTVTDADGLAAPGTPWELERWLSGSPSVYCDLPQLMHPAHFRWQRLVPASELERLLRRHKNVGRLKSLRIMKRTSSGRVSRVAAVGTAGELDITREQKIRSLLVPGSLRSTLFSIRTRLDAKGRPSEFLFYGGGWGHGVGLCQYGAAGRAVKGQTYLRILDHYYPGAKLESPGF